MQASPLVAALTGWIVLSGCAAPQRPAGSAGADGSDLAGFQRGGRQRPGFQAAASGEAPPQALPFHLPCEENDLVGCTNGCTEHHVEDCVTLGAMYLRGDIVSIDTDRATELFRGACTEGSARGCIRLGDAYHGGLLHGDAEGTNAYRRACDAGANLGCLAAGRAYLVGRGVGADPVYAAALFRRVCDLGNAPACVELARLHADGEGVPRDPLRATELYTKACKLGSDEGCLLASRTGEILPPRE
jgi:TPR repeat protein